MPRWGSVVSVFDGLIFVVLYVLRGLHVHTFALGISVGYWLTVWLGLILAVYGFFPLTRGGETQLRRSVLCIVFTLLPACVGLVTLLGHLGTPVGHGKV